MKRLQPVYFILFSLFCIVLVTVISCKKENSEHQNVNTGNGNEEQGYGTIEGTIYAINETSKLPAVKVFVDVDGELYLTKTNKQGDFTLSIPEGNHILHIHTGSGKYFFSSVEISVNAGETFTLPKNQSILNQQGSFAYIQGALDKLETIVMDSLGYQIDELFYADFLSLSTLQSYDIIFINCGSNGASDFEQLLYDNLEQYLEGGGNLFISDHAVSFIKGDGNIFSGTHSHGDEIPPAPKTCTSPQGGFIDDNELCTFKNGSNGFVYSNILDPDLELAMGTNQIVLYYEMGAWEAVQTLGNNFDVLMSDNSTGPTSYGPLVILSNQNASWAQGSGTPSQGGDFVTICHTPPGNPGNPQTITIASSAVQAHLNHGCTIGACEGNGGRILYTTFHNHPEMTGQTTQEKVALLQFFILNF